MQADAAGNDIFGRRVLFAVLFAATTAGSLALAALALSPGGFGMTDIILLALFAVTLPWMVAGFWNAVIGFLIMRFSVDPAAAVVPMAGRIRGDEPVTASTAILLCIRNELPERMIRNLEPMLAGLDAAGYGERFHLYVLSDEEHKLFRLDNDFHKITSWKLPVKHPEGLAFDGDTVYVASDSEERLYVFELD